MGYILSLLLLYLLGPYFQFTFSAHVRYNYLTLANHCVVCVVFVHCTYRAQVTQQSWRGVKIRLLTNVCVHPNSQTPQQYNQLYERERGTEYSEYHGFAYDGIWVIARALERLLSDDDDDNGTQSYSTIEHRLRGIRVGKALNETSIRGVTVV